MKRDRTGSKDRGRGGKVRAALVGMMLSVTATVHAKEPARPADGRGWIFGGGISSGQMGFAGAEGKAVAVGEVVEHVGGFLGTPLVAQRRIQVIDASVDPPAGTVRVAPFPTGVSAGGINLYGGYAFSPRVSVLADVELMATDGEEGFQHIVGGVVVRYWPARRVWIEAGPATGDVGYSLGAEGTKGNSITGPGVLAAAGLTVIKKPRWTVDLQVRYGRVWYDGFQGHNLSFGLSMGRVRSGEASGGGGS
jgi:hypothetical protein